MPKSGNKMLNNAKSAKKDEFYTQLTDIEKELRHYRKHFKDKTVFCNCDDPFESNFFKYFVLNFNRLGLKKLIATCYLGSPIAGKQFSLSDLFDDFPEEDTYLQKKQIKPYKAVVTTVYDKSGDGSIDMMDVARLFESGENQLTRLKGDGDFRSAECLKLMDEADIVVTNPPFSLFREYVALLISRQKKFIIIGNMNAVHYKEIFPLFMNNEIWLGASIHSGDRAFFVPDDYPLQAAGCGVDEETGRKYIRVKGVRWFTNLDIKKRHEELILFQRYSPEKYPSYYNYDGIDVNKTSNIPCDYAGYMGVPDTFLSQFNPDQFELIGLGTEVKKNKEHIAYKSKDLITYEQDGKVVWSTKYTVSERKAGNSLRIEENGLPGKLPYSRIIIRNKHPELPKET